MNRRQFIRVLGLGAIATLAGQILTACGGGSSSGSGGSGTSSESDWTSFTVTGGGKTYTVEIDFYHFHNQGDMNATVLSATTAQTNLSIQGSSPHDHRVALTVDQLDKINNTNNGGNNGAATGFQAVTVVSTDVNDHDHQVRITRTA